MKKVVIAVIKRKNKKGEYEYLMVSTPEDFGKYTGVFYPPGGHVEDNESEQDALIREIKEELEADIEIEHHITNMTGDLPGETISWWSCKLQNEEFTLSDEVHKADFFSKEQMKNVKLWPATQKFFEKYT